MHFFFFLLCPLPGCLVTSMRYLQTSRCPFCAAMYNGVYCWSLNCRFEWEGKFEDENKQRDRIPYNSKPSVTCTLLLKQGISRFQDVHFGMQCRMRLNHSLSLPQSDVFLFLCALVLEEAEKGSLFFLLSHQLQPNTSLYRTNLSGRQCIMECSSHWCTFLFVLMEEVQRKNYKRWDLPWHQFLRLCCAKI